MSWQYWHTQILNVIFFSLIKRNDFEKCFNVHNKIYINILNNLYWFKKEITKLIIKVSYQLKVVMIGSLDNASKQRRICINVEDCILDY